MLDPEGAAMKCWPGSSCVPGLKVSRVKGVFPQALERLRIQLLMSTVLMVGLNNSINSSAAPPGPRLRNSLITMCWAGAGVSVSSAVGVIVNVGVGVVVKVSVGV